VKISVPQRKKTIKKLQRSDSVNSENPPSSASKTIKKSKKTTIEQDQNSNSDHLPPPKSEAKKLKVHKTETTVSEKKKKPTNPDFPVATDDDFNKLIALAKSTDKWAIQHYEGKMKIWEQPSLDSSSNISIVKLETTFDDIEAVTLYDALHDPDYRKEWDDRMVEGYLIEQIDFFNDVGYYHASAPPGFADRDWVNQRSWTVRGNEYIIMNHSVIHSKMPERKGIVRAKSIITGYIVEALDKGCALTYCTQNDSRGWIPTWIKNYVTKKFAPSIVEKMHKAAAEYEQWKAKQDPPQGRPWREFD